MSIGFVIGRAGTGKTRHCLGKIMEMLRAQPMGPAILWIVPRQATFSTERLLLNEFGPYSRCRIVSFDRLGDEVLGTAGGAASTQISARGRQMILGLLLRQQQDRLAFFSSSARRVGLARELDYTFAELERSGAALPELVATLEAALGADPTDADTQTLLDKSRDLNLLYAEYVRFLGPDRLDPQRRLECVLKLLCDCPTFHDANVYIDGFTDFTRHERQMITGLAATCHEVTVTALIDPRSPVLKDFHLNPDDMSLFHKVERSYHQLMVLLADRGVKVRPLIKLAEQKRFPDTSLVTLEKAAFDGKAMPVRVDDSIERLAAPDRVSEVDALARRIRDLTRTGARLNEMVVLVRDLSKYQHLITTSFREHGISHFIDARRPAMHHPLLQWLRAVFAVARRNWPHDDTIALLKTGLADTSLEDADEIENYVLHHGMNGAMAWEAPEPWAMARGSILVGEGDEAIEQETIEPSKIDQARQSLLKKLRPFLDVVLHQPRLTFRQICSELFRLIAAFGVRATISGWIKEARAANKLELAAEHEQTWASLIELFDELVELLGDHEVSLDDFVQTLEAGLEAFDFALTPPTLDQVSVGEIERSRVSDAKITFVLGLSEGLFPMVSPEPTVLTDSERGLLRRRSIELDDDSTRRLLDERLLGYLAFTRASQRLILSRPSAEDGGKPLNASPFWLRLDELFIDITRVTTLAPCYAHDKAACLATPRQLLTGLMRWARKQADSVEKPDATWAALYDAVARMTADHDSVARAAHACSPADTGGPHVPQVQNPIAALREQSWRALSYKNDATLDSAIAAQLFPSPLEATVARIETFAACPFKHFAQYGLKLKSRDVRDFTIADIGQAYHQILDQIVQGLLQAKQQWADLTPEQTAERISTTAAAIAKEMRDEVMLSSARNKYLLRRIEHTLSQVLASQRALADRQTLRPARTSVKFGSAGDKLKSPLIKTPDHREVRLQGKVDRIDQVPGTPLFSLVDYKSGGASLNFQDVYYGLAMQLLAYMLVLRENSAGNTPLTPIGAFYYSVSRSLQSKDHPADVADPGSPEFNLRVKPRGILHGDFLSKFDKQLDTGSSMAVNAFITKDKRLGNRDRSDVADRDEITLLLDYVKDKIAKLADDLMAGVVAVTPYRLGTVTPCSRCDFRSVCRFEVGINSYHKMPPMKRSAVMEAIGGAGGDDA
ncbi:helicase-exonuclease AddAB subunit AddB [soil metagenome]